MIMLIDLEDKIWTLLDGGYKMPYNASIALKRLKNSKLESEQEIIFKELWDNLHHQGDVGLASYFAVPHIISICIERNSLDWNYIGLCVLIEKCRLKDESPAIPAEFQDQYFEA